MEYPKPIMSITELTALGFSRDYLPARGKEVKNKELWQQYRKLAAGHRLQVYTALR